MGYVCVYNGDVYAMETKLEYLLGSGNTLDMFQIQKY